MPPNTTDIYILMPEQINTVVSEQLHEIADLLEQQAANPFRVRAFRKAAETVAGLRQDLRQLAEDAEKDQLLSLPNIGSGIAAVIREIVSTGRCSRVERLRGALDPEHLFQTVPGIGPETARRLHERLHVDTLEALESAAHDGRLETVPGVGVRRAAAIRAALGSMLSRRRIQPAQSAGGHQPPVELVLLVDAEYRRRAVAGELPTITPRRFNPEQQAWLPVLHSSSGEWHFTAIFSNTARAHALGRTRDWVVVYFYDADHQEGQHTVVTETHGALLGRRVVRGRESECMDFYQLHPADRRSGSS